jgi:hypothetical protein
MLMARHAIQPWAIDSELSSRDARYHSGLEMAQVGSRLREWIEDNPSEPLGSVGRGLSRRGSQDLAASQEMKSV